MNCSPTDSKNRCKVVSKYFVGKPVMDESLVDFQEKKKNSTGPKNKQKFKIKSKSGPKRIRGQKDIRTALKSKKNELVAYSNEFDKICKQSGIDVDSEQLQLAIALSKSVQKSEDNKDSESSGSLSTQDCNSKIRTTLQEYGFVVPEIKITAIKSKKLKKNRNNYKLLMTSAEEKQQVISDRYSKVLFNSFDDNRVSLQTEFETNPTARLYHLVTDSLYEDIKYDHVFFVENLFEKSINKLGCLLRDWSEIPGRPVSPDRELSKFNFNKLDYSAEELDNILSGTLKTTQEIAKSKSNLLTEDNLTQDTNNETKMDTNDKEILELNENISANLDFDNIVTKSQFIDIDKSKPTVKIDVDYKLTATQNIRSCSPDLFDDEVSSIMDNTKGDTDFKSQETTDNLRLKAQKSPFKNSSKVCVEVMDLTECIVVNSQRNLNKKTMSQLSQATNVTKRRSSDFMDMTECVTGSSQPIIERNVQNINLTQNSNEGNKMVITEEFDKTVLSTNTVSMDLTQSSDSNDLPVVNISGKKSLDDTIIINDNDHNHIRKVISVITTELPNEVPMTPRKDSIEEVIILSPIILESPEENLADDQSPNSTVLVSKYEVDAEVNKSNNNLKVRATNPGNHISPKDIIPGEELPHSRNMQSFDNASGNLQSPLKLAHNTTKSKTESFFEEFIHHHSGSSKEYTDEILYLDESVNDEKDKNKSEDIDLTQTDSSVDINDEVVTVDKPQTSHISNSLDIVSNIYVDYDEIYDDIVQSHSSSSKSYSYKSNITVGSREENLVSNSSQNSEVFEISDNELDYSLHKSKFEVNTGHKNIDFGGISVMDNMSDAPSLRQSNDSKNVSANRSMSDSFLPVVHIKTKSNESTIYSPTKSESSLISSPVKDCNKDIITKTPKNSEYVIKTDQVTPMMDYQSMNTPERNAELDKYGLKPFKRKRAIQLLTHVYNQTHPILESCSSEDLPAPFKRLKQSKSPKKTTELVRSQKEFTKSSKKGVSPRKQVPIDEYDRNKDNDIYEITSEIPDIRDIQCSEDEWVFQKREKAKVHSCRVPLHIAFHNYVSCRIGLRDAILQYEPVNIDVIHKGLAVNGCRYDPKDLLKFMDKKCITVKTADNNARNNKKLK